MTQLADRTKLVKPSVTLAIAAKAGKLRASRYRRDQFFRG